MPQQRSRSVSSILERASSNSTISAPLMAGTLFLVSTPIGNLEDITFRAIRVLREVAVIAAEDTRRTANLLSHYGIETKSVSFHEHNVRERLPQLMARLLAGESLALVSDAGTPVVSDPGLELVQACIAQGVPVDAIPGASAPLTLAVVSGFPLSPWTIYGFAPIRSKERKEWLEGVCALGHVITFLEAPHRIAACLSDIAAVTVDRPIIVGRELTKVHQSFYRGTASEVLSAGVPPRGEFTVMLGPPPVTVSTEGRSVSDVDLLKEFGVLTEVGGLSRREIVRRLSQEHQMGPNDVYKALERARILVKGQNIDGD